ncbi:hypothetical protein [Amycolatopsis pigmentata]|uniref:Uncharacterized protein n=1 Tax=Amycolatopsis pigmentata TaxID=450801 RepID=A0ABW5G313_9PSEU
MTSTIMARLDENGLYLGAHVPVGQAEQMNKWLADNGRPTSDDPISLVGYIRAFYPGGIEAWGQANGVAVKIDDPRA